MLNQYQSFRSEAWVEADAAFRGAMASGPPPRWPAPAEREAEFELS